MKKHIITLFLIFASVVNLHAAVTYEHNLNTRQGIQYDMTENNLNTYAFGLESVLSEDASILNVTYRLNNSNATSVNVLVYYGEEVVATVAGGTTIGKNTVALATANLPKGVRLTWGVEVNGTSVEVPTQEAKTYSFYHPSGLDIDNNPENATFGMLLINECMQHVKGVDGYVSTGYGAGIYAFTPSLDLIPNGDQPGYNGGIEFTTTRADGTGTAYAPRRIRISEDGRIFVTSLNTDGNYLWEVNPANMNEWTTVFSGELNENKELVDAEGNFVAAPNNGFDVKGAGENLQLAMYSVNLPGITSGAMSGFRLHEYNLGTATEWATAPSKTIVDGLYAINYTGTQVEYDNEGGVWIASYRGTASDANPGLVHINADGVEDAKLIWNNIRQAGIRFNNDFTKLVVAGNNGAIKKATIYSISKDANGAPVLTEETVIDMAVVGNNLNDFAWDYAGNLYSCSNSAEKLAAWAMPYSGTVVTPAAAEYAFQIGEPVEMVGVVKRAVQLGESTIVLTHETDSTPHIYNVIDGVVVAEISQEGVIARDPENAGDYLAISDIAVTEDGKLVATNYMQTQSTDDYVDAGYKRGETRIYIWNDLAGDPSILFTSKMSSNWFRSKHGLTMAVKGTSDNMEIFMTGIHATSAWARVSSYRVIDGVYVEPEVNHNDHYYYYDINDAIALETTVGTQYELNASPLGDMNWVLDAELINPTEITEPEANWVEIATSVALTEDLGKKFNGATYVTVGEQVLMVAPYATSEGKLAGVEILDITNGFDAAQHVDQLFIDEAVEATAAATAVEVVEGDEATALLITLVADATIYSLEVTLAKGSAYEIYEDEITNLYIDLDNLVLIGGPSSLFCIDVFLGLGEYNMSEDSYQLTSESAIAVMGSDATFIEGYAYEVDAFTPSAKAVLRCEWEDMKLEFHLTMTSAPTDSSTITYELNGGVTNDYGWMSKNDMFQSCMADAGVTGLPSLEELKAQGAEAFAPIITPLGTAEMQKILDDPKWDWLEAYIMNHQNADANAYPLTEGAAHAGWRYAIAAFFLEMQHASWPKSADFSQAGKIEAFQPAWQHGFANPTDPTEEFVLNAPYKEASTFDGWFATADFSGEKVKTVNAETTGTLYAKWIEYVPTIAEVKALADDTETKVAGVVNFISGKNVYIQDATGGILVYTAETPDFNVGDKIIAKGVKLLYGGAPEVKNAVVEFSESSDLFDVTVFEDLSLLLSDTKFAYFATRVSVPGLKIVSYDSYNNPTVEDALGNQAVCYKMVLDRVVYPVGTKVNVTAVAAWYNGFQFVGDIAGVENAIAGKKEAYTYPVRSDKYALTNNWIFSNNEDNFAANKPGNTDYVRGMAAKDGIMYFINRETESLVRVDAATGIMLEPLKITGDHLFQVQGEDGTYTDAVTYKFNDLKFDNAGNCLIGAIVMAGNKCQPFIVYSVNLETGVATELINDVLWDNPDIDGIQFRFDAFGVYGDVTKNAVVMAADQSSWNVFRWQIKNGVVGKGELISIELDPERDNYLASTATGFGTAPQIAPQDEEGTLFYVDGFSTLPMLFDEDGTLIDDFINCPHGTIVQNNEGETTTLNAGLNGLQEFQVGEEYFLIMVATHTVSNPPAAFALYKFADEMRTFDGLEPLWYFPNDGLGSATIGFRAAVPSVEVNGNTATISIYAVNNGYASYTLTVDDSDAPIRTEETATACDSYTWNGKTYTQSGTYTYTTIAANGNDSIVTLHLTINQTQYVEEYITACDSCTWNGQTYTEGGIYTYITTSVAGCDSIVTLHLTINQSEMGATESVTICHGETYTWNGRTYSTAGEYSITLSNTNGCDSVVTLQLTILPEMLTTEEYVAICHGETYTWNGQDYATAGSYTANLSSFLGCDSTAILHLTVLPEVIRKTEYISAPTNKIVNWRGKEYNETGIYYDTVHFVVNPLCDSVIYMLDLTIADNIDSDKYCGENLTWYYSNGALIITGSGAMFDDPDLLSYRTQDWYPARVNNIVLPEAITHIGNVAFADCANLTSIVIPNRVTSIGDGAFSWTGLQAITIPASVTDLGEQVFEACNGLHAVLYESEPRSINNQTIHPFIGCVHLDTIIAPAALWHCTTADPALEARYGVPHKARYIEVTDGFLTDQAIKYIANNNASVQILDLTNATNTTLPYGAWSNSYQLSTLYLPQQIEVIPESMVEGARNLSEIAIPATVTEIGNYAFAGCVNVWRMTVEAVIPPKVYENTFDGISRSISVQVPAGSEDLYREAAYWREFFIEHTNNPSPISNCQKLLREDQILILRNGKVYTTMGQLINTEE